MTDRPTSSRRRQPDLRPIARRSQQPAEAVRDWCWRLLYTRGRWVLRAVGRWRCEFCRGDLGEGLVTGRMFTRGGDLVVSVVQEGLMRPRREVGDA